MHFLFAACCFVGALLAAVVYVVVLGHNDPKFGVTASVFVQAPFILLGSLAPLLGFALASGIRGHRAPLVIGAGLLAGLLAYGLVLAAESWGWPQLAVFGIPVVWLSVAGVLAGRFIGERQRNEA
jgi:hypothetical protein